MGASFMPSVAHFFPLQGPPTWHQGSLKKKKCRLLALPWDLRFLKSEQDQEFVFFRSSQRTHGRPRGKGISATFPRIPQGTSVYIRWALINFLTNTPPIPTTLFAS